MAKAQPTDTLRIRKLADTSEGERVRQFDPVTGEKKLINPETGAHEPWPLAGVQFEGDPPEYTRVPTSVIEKGVAEGWITREGENVVHAPAGPPENLWRDSHTFVEADKVIFRMIDGDHEYDVTHNPGKYDHDNGVGGTVDWFYDLKAAK